MTTWKHAWATAAVGALTLVTSPAAHGANDVLVQPPTLAAPQRGSVAGSMSRTAFGPADVVRGTYTLPSPFEVPGERGSLLASIFPSYSPEAGLSEWGIGWSAELAIKRRPIVGSVDYAGTDFTSPWGQLELGDDGFYYPNGLSAPVRFALDDNVWSATGSDGTVFRFSERVDAAEGTYAWYLSDVQTVFGDATSLEYERNASGRPFLAAVSYGSRGHNDSYRVRMVYETLPSPFRRFDGGFEQTLDRRVSRVDVDVRPGGTGAYAPRWHYDLQFDQSPYSPVFYLTSVTREFASGTREPAVTYDYDMGLAAIDDAQLAHVGALDPYLAIAGNAGLQPSLVSMLDIERNGLIDLEYYAARVLVHQTDTGWSYEPVVGTPANARCVPTSSSSDQRPRTLVRLTPDADEPHVLITRYNVTAGATDVIVCDRAGNLLFDELFDGRWDLRSDANARLADIDGDLKPDLVHVTNGGYAVLSNVSADGMIGFEPAGSGPLGVTTPGGVVTFLPAGTWVHDMNGDMLPDLIGRHYTGLVIWHGLGAGKFQAEGTAVQLFTDSSHTTPLTNLTSRGLSFARANKDGLTDVLVSDSTHAYLFMNNGAGFERISVPGLEGLPWNMRDPLVADVSGSGNEEVVYTYRKKAYALALTSASTGLMQSADDGKGTRVVLDYARAVPRPGIGYRVSVLDELTVQSSGYDDVSYVYDYDEPVIHSVGQFLVGYGTTRKVSPITSEESTFINDDDMSGLLDLALRFDSRTSDAYEFTDVDYEEAAHAGLRFLRRAVETTGYRSYDGAREVSTRTEYLAYERSICPTIVRTTNAHGEVTREVGLASPFALEGAMHCLADLERISGSHADATLDFARTQHIARNSLGQITQVRAATSDGEVVEQTVTYDSLHRIDTVATPGRGALSTTYDPATGLIARIQAPDGTAVRVDERDAVTDGKREMVDELGGGLSNRRTYRFDGMERLSSYWQSFGGSAESLPLGSFAYTFPTLGTPGRVEQQLLTDAASGAYAASADLMAADGTALATARQIPEGWQLGNVVVTNRNTLTQHTYVRDPITDAIANVSYADLTDATANTAEISSVQTAGFGYQAWVHDVVQSGVTRDVASTAVLTDGAMVTTATENDVLTTRRAVDATGNLLWTEDEIGVRTHFRYDALGRLVGVELADGAIHELEYDALGRPARVSRTGVGSLAYAYAPGTGMLARTAVYGDDGALERTVDFAYDAAGRVSQRTNALAGSGDTAVFSYVYAGGFLQEETGPAYRRTVAHNPDGSVARASLTLADWREVVVENEYFANGKLQRTTRTVRDAQSGADLETLVQEYVYDSYGRLSQVDFNGQPLATLVYDALGRLDRAELPDGSVVAYGYDETTRRRNAFFTDTGLWNAGAQWQVDARGNIASESLSFGGEYWDRTYGYDARGFLTSVAGRDSAASYNYDDVGLPVDIEDERGARTVARAGTDAVWVGDVQYVYDRLGRVVRKGDVEFAYGADGHLASAQRGELQWGYYYNNSGERLLKTENGQPVAAYIEGSHLTEAGMVTPVKISGRLVGVLEGGEFHLVATDPRGTVISDRDGTPRLATPYGVRAERPDLAPALDFVEKGFDADIGTVRMGVRDYDPALSQFLTPDPLFFENLDKCATSPVECNLYGYAGNNPLRYVDPDGTQKKKVAAVTTTNSVAVTTAGTSLHTGKVKGGTVELRSGVGTSSHSGLYTIEYKGKDAKNQHWLQFVHREVITTNANGSITVQTGNITTTGGTYKWTPGGTSTTHGTPGKANYNTDSGSATDPFYESVGMSSRSATSTRIFDKPGSAGSLVVPSAFAGGAKEVVSRFHFDTYLVHKDKVVYRISGTIEWRWTSAAGTPTQTVTFDSGGKTKSLPKAIRERFHSQYASFNFIK